MDLSGRSDGKRSSGVNGINPTRRDMLAFAALGLVAGAPRLAHPAAADGQLTWGIHVSLAPTWFDPADTQGIITPFMVLYALHDAVVKPMPGEPTAPSLAQSWTASEDGLTYEFMLRDNAKFHNGEPVTAEDVKFSFEGYRGASHDLIKDRVAAVEALDPRHLRFRLKAPWSDFLTFYATASGAGWVVPKKYVEQVGDEGFKKAPVGAGPYKLVSFTGCRAGVRGLRPVLAQDPERQTPRVQGDPDETTRLAALQRGEIDIVYSIRGELAEELRRTPGFTLKPVIPQGPWWIYFPEQWDPNSPWHDERVRRAASLAIDRKGINEAITLGYSKITGSIIPFTFEYFWQPTEPVYDPAKAKQLLAEAGYANGFDTGEHYVDSSYSNLGEAVLDNLLTVGIRARLRPLERAALQPKVQDWDRPSRQRRLRQCRAPRRSLSRAAPTPTAATPTSTRSTNTKPLNSITKSAQRSWTRCSSWSQNGRSMHRYCSSPSSTVSDRGWGNPGSA
jgi:peptide/nickel transport system substrate-binding protein